jgi:hypothetical protein
MSPEFQVLFFVRIQGAGNTLGDGKQCDRVCPRSWWAQLLSSEDMCTKSIARTSNCALSEFSALHEPFTYTAGVCDSHCVQLRSTHSNFQARYCGWNWGLCPAGAIKFNISVEIPFVLFLGHASESPRAWFPFPQNGGKGSPASQDCIEL